MCRKTMFVNPGFTQENAFNPILPASLPTRHLSFGTVVLKMILC